MIRTENYKEVLILFSKSFKTLSKKQKLYSSNILLMLYKTVIYEHFSDVSFV